MFRFLLRRDADMTGVSGIGRIAEGVVGTDGKVVLFWLTKYQSIGIYDSLDQMRNIHCHHELTHIDWIDVPPRSLVPDATHL